ncbi:MAG: hypothetical protein AAB497_01010 [Patescibacteria group bacterium]
MPDETTSTDTQAPAPVEPVAAEPTVVAEPEPVAVAETSVTTVPAPAVDAPVEPTIAEPFTAVEQPTPIVQEPSVPQRGDLELTPQLPVNEALKTEVIQEISPVEPIVEQVRVVPVPAQVILGQVPFCHEE